MEKNNFEKEFTSFDQFTGYVGKYDELKKLANEIGTNPEQLINFFVSVGSECIKRTIEVLGDKVIETLKPPPPK